MFRAINQIIYFDLSIGLLKNDCDLLTKTYTFVNVWSKTLNQILYVLIFYFSS